MTTTSGRQRPGPRAALRAPFHQIAPFALLCAAGLAQAQVIEEVELRREGENAIVQVRFTVPVQFRRAVAASSNDLVQIIYDVVPSRDKPNFIDGERRTVGGDGIPRVTISEEGAGTGEQDRRLVVRLDPPTRFTARGGRDRRSIEIVLEGQGPKLFAAPAVPPAPARTAPAPAPAPGTAAASDAQVDARGAELLAQAREAITKGQPALAIEMLNEALNLPPNPHTREAQALAAQARLALGDVAGARSELELFLKLYPEGADADQARVMLAGLPAAPAPGAEGGVVDAAATPKKGTTMLVGAVSQYYYGGNSKIQTQLKDTPLDGQLPVVISDQTLAGVDQKQLLSSVDLNWRSKDEDRDLRFVFRDSFTVNEMPGQADENKLSALYFDWKETGPGLQARVGRQSGLGGGVLGRFDGAQLGWAFVPKWKLSAVAGVPTDKLLDTQRHFYGFSLDAEALAPGLGGSGYVIQQMIDGEIDRRAIGGDLRYVEQGISVFSQLEYDTTLQGLNIASVQGTWTSAENTTVNVLYDRRATPMLMLGNALFFPDPTLTILPRKLSDLLALKPIDVLRQQVADTTAYATQGLLGITTPLSPQWQVGADLRLTNIGAIAPVPGILPDGIPATGNLWSAGLQAIGTNLYSERDTHVFSVTAVRGPDYTGWLASYNHLSVLAERWQVEPSLRFYQQSGPNGLKTSRWAPGFRVTWRGGEKWVLESDINLESSRSHSPTQSENSNRISYSLGYRLDF